MTIASSSAPRSRFQTFIAGMLMCVACLSPSLSSAQESPACLSSDPTQWPHPAKPYFMVVFDTSSSMTSAVGTSNTCGFPSDRLGHGRCALRNVLKAFTGLAHFGLATYARAQSGCSGACFGSCTYSNLPGESAGDGCSGGCGAEPNPAAPNSSSRAGANILVPINFDDPNMVTTNLTDILSYDDNDCTGSQELFASGCTPLNGALRDMYRYLSNQWVAPGGAITYPSPLTSAALGERACRSVNVILITDGDETCDAAADAVNAAQALNAGFVKAGINWSVKVHVVNFAGGSPSQTDAIALAGGTGASLSAINEAQLTTAISNILTASIKPETCDNTDNNCNGCTDEGYAHYANIGQTCCAWASAGMRTTCLNNYMATITPANPGGDLTQLPCTTAFQQTQPANWLCFNPGESCDNVDNNAQNGVDEGIVKCGSPLHCPTAEVCDGVDNNCNNAVDEGGVCAGGCVASPEICDGCDNDCDGIADDGAFAPIACGSPSPANCNGTRTCQPPQPVGAPGACIPSAGFGACSNSPQTESCDSIDNDCDGSVDDGVASSQCDPAGAPPGTVYGFPSQCQRGTTQCLGGASSCIGGVLPSAEVCDGVDNNCDGIVDNGVAGVGQACGLSEGPCSPGSTACVGGALQCVGGSGPQPEICDGIDNNCNGATDEVPLFDAPAAGQSGCWSNAGTSCSHLVFGSPVLTWDPPAGATCTGNGSLTQPCNRGSLTCVSGDWTCQMAMAPNAEACDGVDNDCNGSSDDGGSLCSSGLSCQNGLCRP